MCQRTWQTFPAPLMTSHLYHLLKLQCSQSRFFNKTDCVFLRPNKPLFCWHTNETLPTSTLNNIRSHRNMYHVTPILVALTCVLVHVWLLVKPLLYRATGVQKLQLQEYLEACQLVGWGKARKERLGRKKWLKQERWKRRWRSGLDNILWPYPILKEGHWRVVFQEYINNTAVKAHPWGEWVQAEPIKLIWDKFASHHHNLKCFRDWIKDQRIKGTSLMTKMYDEGHKKRERKWEKRGRKRVCIADIFWRTKKSPRKAK